MRFSSLFAFGGFFAILCLLTACGSGSEPDPTSLGYGYFPLETGQFAEYEVDSVVYVPTGNYEPAVNARFWVREEVGEAFTDLQGNPAFRLYRFRRNTENGPWVGPVVWTVARNENRAERTENNVRFVKMIFPVNRTSTWNGNAFNDQSDTTLHYENVGRPYTLANRTYPNTVTVAARNDSSAIHKFQRLEVYADTVGLVYQDVIEYNYCQSGLGCVFGTRQVLNGFRYTKRLVRHGKL